MTPQLWQTYLIPNEDFRATVQREARAVLDKLDVTERRSTNELVEIMFPEHLARGDGITIRGRIYKMLMTLATAELGDCCDRGVPRKLRHLNKMIRPWVWHSPCGELNAEALAKQTDKEKCCEHCGAASKHWRKANAG